jgi:hypothetical protein
MKEMVIGEFFAGWFAVGKYAMEKIGKADGSFNL